MPIPTPSPPGGASTANGLLYQLLWCILRATTLKPTKLSIREAKTTGDTLQKAQLILEPTDGGDAQEIGSEKRSVIQLKARSTQKTWSLTDIVTKVLPDLYKATASDEPTTYIFVTEGPMGDWKNVYAFFQSLANRQPENDTSKALNNRKKIEFGHRNTGLWSSNQTERTIFNDIVRHIRAGNKTKTKEPIATTEQRVWILLKHFEFRGDETIQQLERNIDELLYDLIDRAEDIKEKRNALVGALLKRTAKGNVPIDPTTILKEHNLGATPLRDWNTHRERAANLLNKQLPLRNYDPAADARPHLAKRLTTTWRTNKPILAITGNPGVGKTWALYQLGLTLLDEAALPILIGTAGKATDDLQQSANTFWQEIKGNNGTMNLPRLADRWEHIDPNNRRFVILLDNLRDPNEAQTLIQQPLESWGVRIALTCTPEAARAIEETNPERAEIYNLDEFTWQERDRFLKHHFGDAWVDIPEDVQELLRTPVLAGVYQKIAADNPHWNPENEYDLVQKFWNRFASKTFGGTTLDGLAVQQLARAVLKGSAYPWTATHLKEHDVDARMIERLVNSGWLQQTDKNRYQFAHDRFLCFAIAKALVDENYDSKITKQELSKTFIDLLKYQPNKYKQNLGYVPMDILYLLLEDNDGQEMTTDLIMAADTNDHDLADVLYSELLPTLGERITPALFERLKRTAENGTARSNAIINALSQMPPETVAYEASKLLDHKSGKLVRAGLRILNHSPTTTTLDRLWQLHKDMQANPERYTEQTGTQVFLYQESFGTLKATVPLDTKWLVNAIANADAESEPVHDLAYLVANLEDNGATWYKTKTKLFEKVRSDKKRSLARCIRSHKDKSEEKWLAENLEDETDFTGPAALSGLAMINPDEALEGLSKIPIRDLIFTRGWHLPRLLLTRPEKTTEQLHTLITNSEEPLLASQVIDDPNTMSKQTFKFLLTQLEAALSERISTKNPKKPPLFHALKHLGNIYRHDLLAILGQHLVLEQYLVTLLVTQTNTGEPLCHELEEREARKLLYLINGDGWTRANNHRLRHHDRRERVVAIKAAWKRANDATKKLLTKLTQVEENWEGHPFEQTEAAEALAVLGETRPVVEAVVQHGNKTSVDLDSLITAPRPFTDGAMQPAFATLESEPGSALAIGFGRRTDKTTDLLNTLNEERNDSEMVMACLHALGYLRDDRPEVLKTLKKHLKQPEEAWVAERACLRIGTNDALRVLEEHAPNDPKLAITVLNCEPSDAAFGTVKNALTDLNDRNAQELLFTAIGDLPQKLLSELVKQ